MSDQRPSKQCTCSTSASTYCSVHPKGPANFFADEEIRRLTAENEMLRKTQSPLRGGVPLAQYVLEQERDRLLSVFVRILEEYKNYEGWDWYGYIRNALTEHDPWHADWLARQRQPVETTGEQK